ncbi:MAG: patatin-like phospholipase family protein [Candidatus Nitrosocosmicus sp.]
MADPNTRRILSLDGGGMRGIFSAKFMELFVQLWGINPNEIWKYYDVITGTSVGGLQALGYAFGMSPTDMLNILINDGPWIFSTSSIIPGVRATTLDKLATMILGGSFYPNTGFVNKLNEIFGETLMSDLKTAVLIPSYNYDTNTPALFSNAVFPDSLGKDEFVKNVALATASAPLYFPRANWGTYNYIDGGVIKNNPANLGAAIGEVKKASANRTCVLSIGTGLGPIGFHDNPTPPPDESNMSFLFSLIGIGITGSQEVDAKQLNLIDLYTLDPNYSYRAQAIYDPNQDTELDNTTTEFIDYTIQTAIDYFNDNIVAISNYLDHQVI